MYLYIQLSNWFLIQELAKGPRYGMVHLPTFIQYLIFCIIQHDQSCLKNNSSNHIYHKRKRMKYRTTTSTTVMVMLAIAVGFISLGLISYVEAAQTTEENNVIIQQELP